MDLQQLRVFREAAKSGGFTRASQELHLSQSTISLHIKRLEEHLGTPLFLRTQKRVYLNEAGRMLLQYVDRIFQEVKNAEMAVQETGYGNAKDKLAKNLLCADLLPRRMRGMKTVGILRELPDEKVVEIGVPVGVIAAILPTTNPTSTSPSACCSRRINSSPNRRRSAVRGMLMKLLISRKPNLYNRSVISGSNRSAAAGNSVSAVCCCCGSIIFCSVPK